MKKNKPKYLKLYKEWIKNGKMPTEGLCETFGHKQLWPEKLELNPEMKLVTPTIKNLNEIKRREGATAALFWGGRYLEDDYVFTPLRQNLVLLMAALNNEL